MCALHLNFVKVAKNILPKIHLGKTPTWHGSNPDLLKQKFSSFSLDTDTVSELSET